MGFESFPSINHRSTIVINPINVTWNNPTNLTHTQQAMVIPVNINQNHQLTLNSLELFKIKKLMKTKIKNFEKTKLKLNITYDKAADRNLQIPTNDANIKNNSMGSSKIYWVNVNVPTSGKIK